MAATYNKKKLSGSTSGMPIKIAAAATPGTMIHTAISSNSEGVGGIYDEIWVYITNTSGSAVPVTIEYGGATDPDNLLAKALSIPANSMVLVVIGMILQNSLVVKAFAGTANVLLATGFVNRVTNDG